MRLFRLVLFGLLSLLDSTTAKIRYDGQQIWRVDANSMEETVSLEVLLHDPAVIVERHRFLSGKPATVHFRVTEKDKDYLESLLKSSGLSYSVAISDVQRQLDLEDLNDEPRAKRSINDLSDFNYSRYHDLEEIEEWMTLTAQKYDFVKKLEIGKSLEGRSLHALHVAASDTSKPLFYMDGATHAREWISTSTLIYICNQILTNNSYTSLLYSLEFYFVPVVNLDGYAYSWTDDRLWRKTRRPYHGDSDNPLCVGVDANRNWDVNFGGRGSLNLPCTYIYHGTHAESEPVVRSLAKFIKSSSNKIKALVSFHNWGQQILYPYNYNLTLHPTNEKELNATGRAMSQAVKSVNGLDYEWGSGARILYIFAGSTSDWAYEKAGIELSFTIELRDTGPFYFKLPPDQILPTATESMAGIEVLANVVIDKYGD